MKEYIDLSNRNILFTFLIVLYIVAFILTVLSAIKEIKNNKEEIKKIDAEKALSTSSIIFGLISVSIIAPFVETLIFQYGIIELTFFIISNERLALITSFVLSTLIFTFAHIIGRDFRQAINRLAVAMCLALTYILLSTTGTISPFLGTFIAHAIWNFIPSVFVPIGKVTLK